jgi:hypothetical protein
MRKPVDQVERCLVRRRCGGERLALGRRDDRIIAAVHQDQAERHLREILPLEVERPKVGADRGGQVGDERGHPGGVGIVQQRHDRAAFGAEARAQIGNVCAQVRELARRDLAECRPIRRIGKARRVGAHEHPLAVGVGRAMAPRLVRALAEIAGREKGEDGLDVVVPANQEHEAHKFAHRGFERGKQGGAGGVRDRSDADRGLLRRPKAARQMADRCRHRPGVLRAQPLGAQIGDLRHQDREARAGKGPSERHQAGIVLALLDRARDQDQGRECALPRPVQIAEQRPGAAPGHRPPPGFWRTRLQSAGLVARGDVGQHLGGLERARRRAGAERQQSQPDQAGGGRRANAPIGATPPARAGKRRDLLVYKVMAMRPSPRRSSTLTETSLP